MAKKSTKATTVTGTIASTTAPTTVTIPKRTRFSLINVGSSVNAKDGDNIRAAFMKVNGNYETLDGELTTFDNTMNELIASVDAVQANTVTLKRFEFSDSLRWIVRHNMNTRSFTETLTDTFGNRFFAPVKIIDENSFEVKLTSATSGAIDVYFGNSR